jgi:hypothetical protein
MASSVFKAKEQPVAVRYWIFFPPRFLCSRSIAIHTKRVLSVTDFLRYNEKNGEI